MRGLALRGLALALRGLAGEVMQANWCGGLVLQFEGHLQRFPSDLHREP